MEVRWESGVIIPGGGNNNYLEKLNEETRQV